MNITDFCPNNQWVFHTDKIATDETTGKQYPCHDLSRIAAKHFGLTIVTPFVQTAIAVAFVAFRLLRLISFWHFWKTQQEPCSFKGRLQDFGQDVIKILTSPLSLLAFEIFALYGTASASYDATKLYCSIEKFQYDQYVLTSFLNMAPLAYTAIQTVPQRDHRVESKPNPPVQPKTSERTTPRIIPAHPLNPPSRPKPSGKAPKPQDVAPSSPIIPTHPSIPQTQPESPNTTPTVLNKSSETDRPKADNADNEKFDDDNAGAVSSTTQRVAKNIFNKKINWNGLLAELKLQVLQQLTPRNLLIMPMRSGLLNFACTSKISKQLAITAKRNWVEREAVSLKMLGCESAEQAINYVIDHRLSRANLLGYRVNPKDLARLIEVRPDLDHLLISINIDSKANGRELIRELEKVPDKLRVLNLLLPHCEQDPYEDLPLSLEKFKQLKILDIYVHKYCPISDSLADAIGKLPSLQSLTVPPRSSFTSKKLSAMLQGPQLRAFSQSVRDDFQPLACFHNVPNLLHLNLERCRIISFSEPEDFLRIALNKLPNIQTLDLWGCDLISEKVLAETLTKLPLKMLKLRKSPFGKLSWSEDFAAALGTLCQLESLEISSNIGVTKGFANALKQLTSLRQLVLGNFHSPEGNEMGEILPLLTSLEELKVIYDAEIDSDKFIEGIGKLKGLQILDLDQRKWPGEKIADALKNLRGLRKLNLDNCSQIPWDLLKSILPKLDKLAELSLSGCKQIPWKELKPIIDSMPYLSKISRLKLFQQLGS